jgi:hypothetical protein
MLTSKGAGAFREWRKLSHAWLITMRGSCVCMALLNKEEIELSTLVVAIF